MEIALGILPLALQFVRYSAHVYDLFQNCKEMGRDLARVQTKFEVEMQWLGDWAATRGLDKKQTTKPKPQDEKKHLMALRILAIIASILSDANSLKTKYIKRTAQPAAHKGTRRRLHVPTFLRPPRSRSPSPTAPPSGDEQRFEELHKIGIKETSSVNEEFDILEKFASDIQKELSSSKKLSWAFRNKDRLENLAMDLKRWNKDLDRLSLPLIVITRPEYNVGFRPQYSRNACFCGRKDVFGKIKDLFWPQTISYSSSLESTIVSLYGLGGVGKSQIAQEYAYRYKEEYSSVFWINADNSTEMEKSCLEVLKAIIHCYSALSEFSSPQKIANALDVFDKVDSPEKLIEAVSQSASNLVKRWLSRDDNTRWLLLIDNYDDPGSLDLNKLLPSGEFGHVIITTRKKDVAGRYKDIYIPEFGVEDGVNFLIERSKKKGLSATEKVHARNIVSLVDGLALVLDHAGAYIFNTGGSFEEYESLLRTKYNKQIFGNTSQNGNKRFATTQHTTNTVWKISFDALCKDAARLLELCSFIGNRGIQLRMLSRGKAEIDWIKDDQIIHHALEDLYSFSLIKREESEEHSFWIHPVVHRWTRNHLVSVTQGTSELCGGASKSSTTDTDLNGDSRLEQEYSQLALYLVTSTFILDDPRPPKEWTYELSIVPHIKCCYEAFKDHTISENDPKYDRIQTALYALARMYARLGYVDGAHNIYTKILEDSKKDSVDLKDLDIMDNFGKNLFLRGEHSEALQWYSRALSGKEKALGDDDLSTLHTRHQIAKVFVEQGEFEKALQEYTIVLGLQKKKLGEDHPSTLETRQSIAVVYKDRGNYTEALSVLEQVRSVKKRTISDKNHPSILDTIYTIAVVLETQGEYKKAELEYERVLEGQRETLGTNHYSTLDTVHSIAGLCGRQGHYEDALKMYDQVLSGLVDIFGEDHPWTLMTVNGMADILDTQGKYDDALEKYVEVYSGFHRRQLGVRGEFMAANDIGRVKNKKGEYKDALEWYKKAEDGQKKELGSEHIATISSRWGTGSVLENQGHYDEALSIYEEVQEGMEKALGLKHSMTYTAIYYKAGVLSNKGQYQDALKCYKAAEQGHQETVGEDHLDTLKAVYGMANVLCILARYDEAMELYKRAQDGLEEKLGKDHPTTLFVMYGIGAVLEHQKQFDVALEKYKYALDGWENCLGKDHPSTLLAAYGMGNVYMSKGSYDDALLQYQRVMDGRLKVLGEGHPLTFHAFCGVASIFKKKRRYSEALGFYKKALEGLEKSVGPDHPLTLMAVYGKAGILEKQRKYTEALALYRRARDGRESTLGKSHPETVLSKDKYLKMKLHHHPIYYFRRRYARRQNTSGGGGGLPAARTAP